MLPPGESRKRKERESTPAFYPAAAKPSISSARPAHLQKSNVAPPPPPNPASNNGLLAGYLAYEFLTRGTILGEKFDPAAKAEGLPFAASSDSRRIKKGSGQAAAEEGKKKEEEERSYAEVASILKTERAHIPGIVNPTQLARWIRM